MQEPADSEGNKGYCLGGWLRSDSQCFLGPQTEAELERMSLRHPPGRPW
jgi:DeoR/GlpR family transcriptional regulator of sugar metabolism